MPTTPAGVVAASWCDPYRGRTVFVRVAGAVAALNHRLVYLEQPLVPILFWDVAKTTQRMRPSTGSVFHTVD
jgi:hypothetical protein